MRVILTAEQDSRRRNVDDRTATGGDEQLARCAKSVLKTPVKLTFCTRSHSSLGISQNGRIFSVEKIEALLTRPKAPPKASTVLATTVAQLASSATSVLTICCNGIAPLLIPVRDAHIHALGDQCERHATADALGGAGDDDSARCGISLHDVLPCLSTVGPHYLGVPYGGMKNSGVGREEGMEEMLSYTETKVINIKL